MPFKSPKQGKLSFSDNAKRKSLMEKLSQTEVDVEMPKAISFSEVKIAKLPKDADDFNASGSKKFKKLRDLFR